MVRRLQLFGGMLKFEATSPSLVRNLSEARRAEILALGFRPEGAYVGRYEHSIQGGAHGGGVEQAPVAGELFVDEARTTILALYRRGDPLYGVAVEISAHTELADGALVTTAEYPKKGGWLSASEQELPLPMASTRLSRATSVEALCLEHRAHVDATRATRRTALRRDACEARWIAAREARQSWRKPSDAVLFRVATAVGLGALGAGVGAVFAVAHAGHPALAALVGLVAIPLVIALPIIVGSWVGPWLVRAGVARKALAQAAERAIVPESASSSDLALTVEAPRRRVALAVVWAIMAVLAIGTAAREPSPSVALSFAYAAMVFGSLFLNRRSLRKARPATLEAEGATSSKIRIEGTPRGEGELLLASVHATLRASPTGPLTLLDDRGRTLLVVRGAASTLDAIEQIVGTRRSSLRCDLLTGPWVVLHALPPILPVWVSQVRSFDDLPRVVIGALALLTAFAPLLGSTFLPRVEVGVDGLVITRPLRRKVYVPFSEIASLDRKKVDVVVTMKTGAKRNLRFENEIIATLPIRAFAAHTERRSSRSLSDDRRRVAAMMPGGVGPFRSRVEDPGELAEAALDSNESQSVRVLAARRLVSSPREDASTVRTLREDIAERIVDPEVRRAL